ncbi:MAG: hypothetical protein MUF87_21335, partial [Anaerolineae bacterium]|nr:hypothetical protein [Anaerolineae bacterium]
PNTQETGISLSANSKVLVLYHQIFNEFDWARIAYLNIDNEISEGWIPMEWLRSCTTTILNP